MVRGWCAFWSTLTPGKHALKIRPALAGGGVSFLFLKRKRGNRTRSRSALGWVCGCGARFCPQKVDFVEFSAQSRFLVSKGSLNFHWGLIDFFFCEYRQRQGNAYADNLDFRSSTATLFFGGFSRPCRLVHPLRHFSGFIWKGWISSACTCKAKETLTQENGIHHPTPTAADCFPYIYIAMEFKPSLSGISWRP